LTPKDFLAKVGAGKHILEFGKDQHVFEQGDVADTVFYIQRGRVKLTVVSEQGCVVHDTLEKVEAARSQQYRTDQRQVQPTAGEPGEPNAKVGKRQSARGCRFRNEKCHPKRC
jgi:CRP-like cAMP-binding protein